MLERLRRTIAARPVWGLLILPVAVAVLLIALLVANPRPVARQYAIVPIVDANDSVGLRSADSVLKAVYEAADSWKGLPLVGRGNVATAITQAGVPRTLAAAKTAARRVGATDVVYIIPTGSRLRLGLASATEDSNNRLEPSTVAGESSTDLRGMLQSAIRAPRTLAGVTASDVMKCAYEACLAFDRGAKAFLDNWDLPEAASQFTAATAADLSFGAAWLWRAELASWMDYYDKGSWRDAATRAANSASSQSLGQLARALVAMADTAPARACAIYDSVLTRDATDYLAVFGKSECLYRDDAVIVDGVSRTRRFRASLYGAGVLLDSATRMQPALLATLAFDDRLQSRIIGDPLRTKAGSDAARHAFTSIPELRSSASGDSVVFTPFLQDSTLPAPSKTFERAFVLSRSQQRAIVDRWIRQRPRDADAQEASASAFEVSTEPEAALEAMRSAMRLARKPEQRVRMAVGQVQLFAKLDSFVVVRRIADSLLDNRDVRYSDYYIGLAALTGRLELLAGLSAQTGLVGIGKRLETHSLLTQNGARVLALALLGVCGTRLDDALAALKDNISNTVADQDQQLEMHRQRVEFPLRYAVPCNRALAAEFTDTADPVVVAERALAANDTATVRTSLSALSAARTGVMTASSVSLDEAFIEAWLWSAIGDTAHAVSQLDSVLRHLRMQSVDMLGMPWNAAGLVRAMQLRADIATRQGDRPVAQRWSSAVRALWAGADPAVYRRP